MSLSLISDVLVADLIDAEGERLGADEAAFGEADGQLGDERRSETPLPQTGEELVPELDVMSDDDLVNACQEQLKTALDGLDGELVGNWSLALRYYASEHDGMADGCIDSDKGVANAVSRDVADMIEATMAQIMPTFEGSAVFRFGAVGQTDAELSADERAAEQESEAVNHVLMSLNRGYVVLQEMFRDALLMRCGFVKVTTDRQVSVSTEEYEDLTPDQVMRLSMDPAVSVGRVGNRYLVRRYEQAQKINIDAVPQEEMKYSNGWHSPFFDGVPFIAHTRITRRSELIELGYDPEIVQNLPTESQETTEVAVVRSSYAAENQYYSSPPGSEPTRYSECYILIDYDGDGIPELRKVCIGGQSTLLANEPADAQPFVMAVPILRSHRSTGWSLFDRLKDVQDVKTESLNQHIDNIRWCNMPDVDVVDKQVNIKDVLDRRPGGINRMRSPGAIQRNPPIPAGEDALRLLEYMDKMRSERGGASLDLQAAQLQVAGESAHGVERQISSKERMATFLASNLVHTGLLPLCKKIHDELRRNPQVLVANVGGQRSVIDTSQWKKRDEVELTSAVTLGDQQRRIAALGGVTQQQQQLMQTGQDGVLVDLQGVYNAMLDQARLAGLSNPEQYFVDPSSEQAQLAMQGKQQAAQQQQMQAQQQAEQTMQFQMALAQIQVQVAEVREQGRLVSDQMKLAQQAAERFQELQLEYEKLIQQRREADQDTATDLTRIEAEHDRDVPGSVI